MNEEVQPIFDGIVAGKTRDVLAGIQDALGAGVAVDVIINNGMIAAMSEVGYRFEDGEIFVPEMLVAARAMQAGMDAIRPYITEGDIQPAGRVLFGTVSGDLHDIGKNLVSVMLEGAGFVVVDLGKDVSAPEFVKAVREQEPDILALSALLTTTMPESKGGCGGVKRSRYPQRGESAGRGCTSHAGIRRPDRCRRLCAQCRSRRYRGQRPDGHLAVAPRAYLELCRRSPTLLRDSGVAGILE